MLILLPPSETKRPGGKPGSVLELTSLRFAQLAPQRSECLEAIAEWATDVPLSLRALGLKENRVAEVEKNQHVFLSPVMAAALRYTGVLYDALDASSLPEAALKVLRSSVAIHTAILGPVGAMDAIPDYRLSADSRFPGLSLKRLWAQPVSSCLESVTGLVVDARSQSYVALGPAPTRHNSVYLHVVTEGDGGVRRALNHFNKKAKGELVRALALDRCAASSVDELLAWARSAGFRLDLAGDGSDRRLELVV